MYVSAVFLPLIGSFIAGILVFVGANTEPEKKKNIDQMAHMVTVGAMLLSAVAATIAFIDVVVTEIPLLLKSGPGLSRGP